MLLVYFLSRSNNIVCNLRIVHTVFTLKPCVMKELKIIQQLTECNEDVEKQKKMMKLV